MSSTKKTETEATKDTSSAFNGLKNQLAEGVDVLLRVHNDWLDMASKQQAQFFAALQEGVGHLEKAIDQATDRYRQSSGAWGARLSDAAKRTAA